MQLSILIAAYNVDAFIEKCIWSCYVEKLANHYEIIVVNDGSTDQTKLILEKLKNSIKNLVIVNKNNEGLGAARNTGLVHAQGDFVWMIDGDDFLEKKSIVQFISNYNKSNSDVYAFNFNIVNEEGDLLAIKYSPNYIETILTGNEYYKGYSQNSYTWQYIFKRKIFINHQLNFKERINMQDSEILPKIMFYAKTVQYIDVVAYNYVQQENSFTNSQNPEKRYKYFESIIEVRNSLLEFSEKIKTEDALLYSAILDKLETLHQIIFNHLVFFKYEKNWLLKCLKLLKQNAFYPLQYKAKGKMVFVKWGLNNLPIITKKMIDRIV